MENPCVNNIKASIDRPKGIRNELMTYIRKCQFKAINENLMNEMQSHINGLFCKYELKCIVNVSLVDNTVTITSVEGHDIFNNTINMTLNELREEKLKRVLEDDEQ
ncbi:hypothetical protein M0Q97_02990 [Candidatus Dojkabacteria bacterium]|jgi:hypothetical protein|nr:hypothetical protein [Candidatus Dojkabacteria bacterium]